MEEPSGTSTTTPSSKCFKTCLNTYVQRVVRRPLLKDDIVYTLVPLAGHYQVVVELACFDGVTFAGEVCDNYKEAFQSCAQKAFTFYEERYSNPCRRGREGLSSDVLDYEAISSANPSLTPKVLLNTLCTRLAKRFLSRGETVYTVTQIDGGLRASVRSRALPGKWRSVQWLGSVCSSKREAEHSAASAALESLRKSRMFDELFEDLFPQYGSFMPDQVTGSELMAYTAAESTKPLDEAT